MFRDLKEYQDIAKIYAEKVSKPENLEERRGTELSKDQIQKNREGFKNTIMTGNPEGKKPVNTSQSNRQKLTQQRQKQNKGRVEKQFGFLKTKPSSEFQGRKSRSSQNMQGKTKPEPEYKPEKGVVFGQRTNEVGAKGDGKPSSGDLSMFKDKKTETETKPQSKFIRDPKTKTLKRRGSPTAQRAENKEKAKLKAQAMAKARIAAKKDGTYQKPKTAQELAKERIAKKAAMKESALDEKMNINPGSGRDTVNEPAALKVYRNIRTVGDLLPGIGKSLLGKKDAFKDFDKKQAEKYKNPKGVERVATGIADKITGDKFDFDMRGKSKDKNKKSDIKSSYEYDAYDLVLEYLLSSEQAATIEEANYVMTEMDAETIQGIVEAQKKTLMKEQG